VDVLRYKFVAVLISGGLAGLAGGFLALVASSTTATGRPAAAATSAWPR
jgi:simple sugar transport system permease protein